MSNYNIKIEELEIVSGDDCVIGHCEAYVEFDVCDLDQEITVNSITISSAIRNIRRNDTVTMKWDDEDLNPMFASLSESAISHCEEEILAMYWEDRKAS